MANDDFYVGESPSVSVTEMGTFSQGKRSHGNSARNDSSSGTSRNIPILRPIAIRDDFYFGESAPVTERGTFSQGNSARQGYISHDNSARGKFTPVNSARDGSLSSRAILKQNTIHEVLSNQSLESNQSEMHDFVAPLQRGIRRNAMDSDDINQIEHHVFTDPIFERHRKPLPPRIVVHKNVALTMDSTDHRVHIMSSLVSTGDITPIYETDEMSSTKSRASSLPSKMVDPTFDVVVEASKSLKEKIKMSTDNNTTTTISLPNDHIITVGNVGDNQPITLEPPPKRVTSRSLDDKDDTIGQRLLDDHVVGPISSRRHTTTSSLKSTAASPSYTNFGKWLRHCLGYSTIKPPPQPVQDTPSSYSSRAYLMSNTLLSGGRESGAKIAINPTIPPVPASSSP